MTGELLTNQPATPGQANAALPVSVCRDLASVGHKTRPGGGPMQISGPENWSIISLLYGSLNAK